MSVQEIADHHALCMWFDAAGQLQEHRFLLGSLRKVAEEPEG